MSRSGSLIRPTGRRSSITRRGSTTKRGGKLVDYSSLLFERLGCRDYARFDFRADDQGEVKLLEVNPNPGWCWDGKLNYMAGYEDLRYADLLRMIVEAAQERIAAQNHKAAAVPAPAAALLLA